MGDVLTKEAEESMRRIVSLHKVRLEKQKALERAESEVKLCRRAVDKAQEAVNEAIEQESTPTLFSAGIIVDESDLATARQKLLQEEAKPEAKPVVAAAPVAEGDMKWRAVPTDSLDLPGSLVTKLKAHLHNGAPANLDTLGGLADWKNADRWFTDVKGVGKAAATKIDDAIVAYFEKNPRTAAAEPAKATEVEQAAAQVAGEAMPAPVVPDAAPPAAATAAEAKPKRSRKAKAAK